MSDLERKEAASLLSILISKLNPDEPFEVEPGRSESASMAKGALLTKMIYGLAGPAQQSQIVADSKMEMYADAIEDLPAWAIDLAIKRWARGSCPAEINDSPKFEFPPSPATLRALANDELDTPKKQVRLLQNLLAAEPIEQAMDPTPRDRQAENLPMRRM